MKKIFVSIISLLVYAFLLWSPTFAAPAEGRWVDLGTLTYDGRLFKENEIDNDWHFIALTDPDTCRDEIKGLNYKPKAPQDADEIKAPTNNRVDYVEKIPGLGDCEIKPAQKITLTDPPAALNAFEWIDSQKIASVDLGQTRSFTFDDIGGKKTYGRSGDRDGCIDTIDVEKAGDPTGTLTVRVGTGIGADEFGLTDSAKSNRLGDAYDGFPFRPRLDYEKTLDLEVDDCWVSDAVQVNIVHEDKGKPTTEEDVNGDGIPDIIKLPGGEPEKGFESDADFSIDPKNVFGDEEIPGITCGDASTEKRNKCCAPSTKPITFKIGDPRFFCFLGVCASELPKSAFEKFLKGSDPMKAMEQIQELSNKQGGCVVGKPDRDDYKDPSCRCLSSPIQDMCERYLPKSQDRSEWSEAERKEIEQCLECAVNSKGVWTGLSCIKATPAGFTESLMGIGLSFAGIFALLCILYSAFLLQISQGNPDRIKKARELLNSCIIGLILIIFAVLIMQIVGVNILRIPGFGS